MRVGIIFAVGTMGVFAATNASAAIVGNWQLDDNGWWDVAFSPTTPPGGGTEQLVCGVYNDNGTATASNPNVINCMFGAVTGFYDMGFYAHTAGQPTHLAMGSDRIWVTDTNGELWYGYPSGPITIINLGESHTTLLTWKRIGAVPGGCSGQVQLMSSAGQLASDGVHPYVIGCDGYVYYYDGSTFTNTSSNQSSDMPGGFTAIGFSPHFQVLWGLGADPMYLVSPSTNPSMAPSSASDPLLDVWQSNFDQIFATSGSDNGNTLFACAGNASSGISAVEYGNTPCIANIGGAITVAWNYLNGEDSTLSFLKYQVQGGTPTPKAADQFGTASHNTWDIFSYEFPMGSTAPNTTGVLPPNTYSTPPKGPGFGGYPPLFRVMEGGSGVGAPAGMIDLAWIITNDSRLYAFYVPTP
jgi:hypothetical protein